jgi:hypothetical protein
MSTRAVTELLHAGVSNHDIARETGIDHRTVAATRAALGLPDARTIKGQANPEDLYWRRTKPVDGGHLEWDGHRNNTGVPVLHTAGRMYTARRVAFRIRWGREPIGNVTTGCDHNGCVHPDHVEDQPMRQRYTAIFGEVAA